MKKVINHISKCNSEGVLNPFGVLNKLFPGLLITLFLFSLFLFSSCKKDEAINSTTPTINIESVSSTNIAEGDAITFKISYTDGDGDLGENNPDVTNLFLTDNRINITYKYRIQQLAPDGSSVIIKGNLDVVLNSTAITDGSNSQSVTYSVYVVDRAGQQSNSVVSAAITIHK